MEAEPAFAQVGVGGAQCFACAGDSPLQDERYGSELAAALVYPAGLCGFGHVGLAVHQVDFDAGVVALSDSFRNFIGTINH